MRHRILFLFFYYKRKDDYRKRQRNEERRWRDILLEKHVTYLGAAYPNFELIVVGPNTELDEVQQRDGNRTYVYLPSIQSHRLSIMLFVITSFFHLIRNKPSLVYSFTYGDTIPFLGALAYSKLARVPFFVDLRNPPSSILPNPLRQLNFLERLLLGAADRITLNLSDRIVHMNLKSKELQKDSPKLYSKSIVVDSCAKDNWFKNREELKPHPDRMRFAYWGTMARARGLQSVIRGFAKALSDYEETQSILYLIGTGDGLPELRKLARDLGCAEEVVFLEYVPQTQLVEFLGGTDVAVVAIPPHPFFLLSSPTKLVEAVAVELPILASDIEPNHMVKKYNLGYLCKHDENGYREGFRKFMKCDNLGVFSRNCRRIKPLFTSENIYEELNQAIQRVLVFGNENVKEREAQ